jgi:hypothetical protein
MRRILASFILWMALVLPAVAEVGDIRHRIEAALVAQGYSIVSVERTWLGRLRIVAQNSEIQREIVLHMTTGEVLRDYSVAREADDPATRHANRQSDRDDRGGDDVTSTAAAPLSGGADTEDAPMQALEGAFESLPIVVVD